MNLPLTVFLIISEYELQVNDAFGYESDFISELDAVDD